MEDAAQLLCILVLYHDVDDDATAHQKRRQEKQQKKSKPKRFQKFIYKTNCRSSDILKCSYVTVSYGSLWLGFGVYMSPLALFFIVVCLMAYFFCMHPFLLSLVVIRRIFYRCHILSKTDRKR